MSDVPTEHHPHPAYEYEPPCEVVINGRKCIEVDAVVIPWAADIAARGAALKFPKPQK
jgi:hypothetical protein